MFKKIIIGISAVVVLTAGYVGFAALTETPVQAASTTDIAAMQAEIAELRALIQSLTGLLGQQATTPIAQISTQRAREIAVEFVGSGTALTANLFVEDGVPMFEVEVQAANSSRSMIYINAVNSTVVRMTPITTPELQPVTPTAPVATPPPVAPPPAATAPPATNVTTSGRTARPANPAISRDRAIQIAEADMRARGLSGWFDSIEMDWEMGQWVWEVEFDSSTNRNHDYEWYINVDTGAIVRFRIDR
ncbi:MAG: PepSY domain-containing protein [Defluviitaleaceae bacterium]|nr:PepSY domain-containing protein [Defluviitaleaceae bacterium]